MDLMTAKTMAEVLSEHHVSLLNEGGFSCFSCNYTAPSFDAAITHQAAALSAAGFGLVADAKAEALEEAAETIEARAGNLAAFWNGKEATDLVKGSWSAMRHEARTIRARAAALRGDS